MYPDSLYATSRGSFLRPVPLPQNDPDVPPTVSVSLACEWLPVVRGALQQLLLQSTWKTDDPAELLKVQGQVSNLIDLFQECDPSTLPFACDYDYLSSEASWGLLHDSNVSPDFYGEYIAGAGWFATDTHYSVPNIELRGCYIQKTFSPSISVTKIGMTYDVSNGSFVYPGYTTYVQAFNGVSLVIDDEIDAHTQPQGSNITFEWLGSPTVVDKVVLALFVGNAAGSTSPGGSGNIKQAEILGVGTSTC